MPFGLEGVDIIHDIGDDTLNRREAWCKQNIRTDYSQQIVQR